VFVDGRSNASTDKQERSRVGNRMRGSYGREAVNPQSITVRMPCLRHRFSRMTIVRCLPCEVISCGTIQSRRTVWGHGWQLQGVRIGGNCSDLANASRSGSISSRFT
jgi:hypothetical protein